MYQIYDPKSADTPELPSKSASFRNSCSGRIPSRRKPMLTPLPTTPLPTTPADGNRGIMSSPDAERAEEIVIRICFSCFT